MGGDDLHSRVAVNTDNIASLGREQARHRDKIHELESTAYAVKVLTRAVDELHETMPNLARRAAREAVDEFLRRRHADTLSNWRTYAAMLAAGAALGALIVGLVLR